MTLLSLLVQAVMKVTTWLRGGRKRGSGTKAEQHQPHIDTRHEDDDNEAPDTRELVRAIRRKLSIPNMSYLAVAVGYCAARKLKLFDLYQMELLPPFGVTFVHWLTSR